MSDYHSKRELDGGRNPLSQKNHLHGLPESWSKDNFGPSKTDPLPKNPAEISALLEEIGVLETSKNVKFACDYANIFHTTNRMA